MLPQEGASRHPLSVYFKATAASYVQVCTAAIASATADAPVAFHRASNKDYALETFTDYVI